MRPSVGKMLDERLAKEAAAEMSWRVTLHVHPRRGGGAAGVRDDLFPLADEPPVIVADEPDPARPDDWRIHAYFAEQPTTQELVLLRRLAAGRRSARSSILRRTTG